MLQYPTIEKQSSDVAKCGMHGCIDGKMQRIRSVARMTFVACCVDAVAKCRNTARIFGSGHIHTGICFEERIGLEGDAEVFHRHAAREGHIRDRDFNLVEAELTPASPRGEECELCLRIR